MRPPSMSLHGLQAESEIFRRAQCQEMEEEADYEEYQRRMRAAAKAKAGKTLAPPVPRPPLRGASAPAPQPKTSVQAVLEGEHQERVEARARLEERDHRLDDLLSNTLSGQLVRPEAATLNADELRKELKDNARALQSKAVDFVASYGK